MAIVDKMTKEELQRLIVTAKKVRENALDYKSKHPVGAAVLTRQGNVYAGCNIDGIISSQGSCAEVNAINHAVAHGEYAIRAVCVYDRGLTYPCGSCLQYLSQYAQIAGEEPVIVMASESGEQKTAALSDLLPKRFVSTNFAKVLKSYSR